MRNALFVLGKALCGALLLQIALKYIFLGPVGYVLQFVEKPPVLTASLMFFAGIVLLLQAIGNVYDVFSKDNKAPNYRQQKVTCADNWEPSVVFDDKNKHVKILGKHKVTEFLKKIDDIDAEEWTVSGQNETYFKFPERQNVPSVHYRIGEQHQNLPTETICE